MSVTVKKDLLLFLITLGLQIQVQYIQNIAIHLGRKKIPMKKGERAAI